MKKSFALALIVASMTAATAAQADTYVHGYTRGNGTYVQPHVRSSPDSSYNNNWTTQGNVNPYTGESGTRAPTWNDSAPSDSWGKIR